MQEMQEKGWGRDLFFSAARVKNRPYSVYTEFMESETEIEQGDDPEDDSEVYSEFGDLEGIDDGECSPRISLDSVGGLPPLVRRAQHVWGRLLTDP